MHRPRNRLLTLAFGLALVLALAFGVRVATGWLRWTWASDPPLAEWMPMGYIARSRDVPREVLAEAAGLTVGDAPGRTLAQIAADRGETPAALIARIETAIAAHRGPDGPGMTETAFALLAAWGTPILALTTFLSCLAVPVPTSAMMLASGAFAASGVPALPAVLAVALAGAIAGDQAGYALGRVAGPAVTRSLPPDPIARARAALDRRGGLVVFLSRWLFSPLGPCVNLLAGAARMGWARFTAAGVTGEAVWVVLYVGLGAAFADQLAALAKLLADSAGLATSVAAAALTGTALWRRHHRAEQGVAFIRIHATRPIVMISRVFLRKTGSHFCATCSSPAPPPRPPAHRRPPDWPSHRG